MELLQGHAALDQSPGEVFEQFGIGGAFSRDAEIARRVADARTEMPLPDAVGDDAGCDRVGDNGAGEFEATWPLSFRGSPRTFQAAIRYFEVCAARCAAA